MILKRAGWELPEPLLTEIEDMEETRGYSIARRPATAGAVRSPSTTSVSRQPAVA